MPQVAVDSVASFAWPGRPSVELRREARRLRHAVGARSSVAWLEAFDPGDADGVIAGSSLAPMVSRLPHPRPREVIAFTLAVTDRAIDDALARPDLTPLERVYLAGHVIEAEHADLIDPRSPLERQRNLAAPKEAGVFFTPAEVAWGMSWLLCRHAPRRLTTLLDPAGGVGNLVAAALTHAPGLERVDVVELSPRLAGLARRLLGWYVAERGLDVDVRVHCGDAVERMAGGAQPPVSAVVMNPPYGRIRATADLVTNAETRSRQRGRAADALARELRGRAAELAKRTRELVAGREVGTGILERSRVFARLAIEMLEPGGVFVGIGPAAWTGDHASLPFRRWLVEDNDPCVLWTFRESNPFFPGVNHPLAVAAVCRRPPGASLQLATGLATLGREPPRGRELGHAELRRLAPGSLRFPRVSGAALDALERLADLPRLGRTTRVSNLRGELDLTVHRDAITRRRTQRRLVRGDHLERFFLAPPERSTKAGYVATGRVPRKLRESSKWALADGWRIAGRQCSYLEKARRLSFAMVPPGVVLGNSCNFVAMVPARATRRPPSLLWALLGLLNSAPLELWFRAFNSNNHVANYELDELPVPKDLASPWMAELGRVARSTQRVFERGEPGESATPGPLDDVVDALAFLALGVRPSGVTDAFVPEGAERAPDVRAVMGELRRARAAGTLAAAVRGLVSDRRAAMRARRGTRARARTGG